MDPMKESILCRWTEVDPMQNVPNVSRVEFKLVSSPPVSSSIQSLSVQRPIQGLPSLRKLFQFLLRVGPSNPTTRGHESDQKNRCRSWSGTDFNGG